MHLNVEAGLSERRRLAARLEAGLAERATLAAVLPLAEVTAARRLAAMVLRRRATECRDCLGWCATPGRACPKAAARAEVPLWRLCRRARGAAGIGRGTAPGRGGAVLLGGGRSVGWLVRAILGGCAAWCEGASWPLRRRVRSCRSRFRSGGGSGPLLTVACWGAADCIRDGGGDWVREGGRGCVQLVAVQRRGPVLGDEEACGRSSAQGRALRAKRGSGPVPGRLRSVVDGATGATSPVSPRPSSGRATQGGGQQRPAAPHPMQQKPKTTKGDPMN